MQLYPGAIGRIAEMHATYYHKNWSFGIFFEAKIDTELASFLKCKLLLGYYERCPIFSFVLFQRSGVGTRKTCNFRAKENRTQ